ncbi:MULTISPECIES: helix-turn-helix domain-containing protein [Pseudomonas]|uniref:GntR family transcriptional regulator n=1 Tax=Pseudomonas putida TaxID=303 RepID=A0A7Z9ES18_PSEPU|nr:MULTISPECIES: helix-turn-helix domain-containing protein [Pseudomonas]ELU0815071.1 helix-turn-helix domain-containing protein [Pseudomonas putida]KAF0256834.1 GntR family transcriptional regulator [Pseudomonas putida]MCE0780579.1 helix-turn-helix domain-containing protein [Pseudomonas sp. NMI542_15]WQE53454.1 helix-turn-helix domain-containing protein [Pseudomonas putida]GLO00894.1 DNA-binding protein [Pseudomonas putida]
MSMELMVKAMKTKVGNPLRKLVLIKLADNASDQGECWPSYQHVAEQCEIDRSTVRKHIKQLEAQGLLRIENREGPKGNSTNLYFLTLSGVGRKSTPVGPESTGVGPQPTGGVGPESTRTSHSSEPVKEPKPMCTAVADGFEIFWKLYPKKKSRKDALKAWNKLNPDAEQQAVMIAALAQHCVTRDWTKDAGQYIPMASTWLNGERWHDVLQPAGATAQGGAFNNLPQHTDDMYQESHDGRSNF